METKGGFLLSKISHINDRLLDKMLESMSVTEFNGAQGRILFVLWRKDAISIKEIGKETGLAKTTLSTMLNRMEKQDLIIKEQEQNDKRVQIIRLSKKSKDLRTIYEEVSNQMNALFYKGFTEQEIEEFDHYLERIYANLNNDKG